MAASAPAKLVLSDPQAHSLQSGPLPPSCASFKAASHWQQPAAPVLSSQQPSPQPTHPMSAAHSWLARSEAMEPSTHSARFARVMATFMRLRPCAHAARRGGTVPTRAQLTHDMNELCCL